MLEKFRQAKLQEIESLAMLEAKGNFPAPWGGARPSFSAALRPKNGLPAIIAEYKRASPSRGTICESVNCGQAVREYVQNGASALSILTERNWFKGSLAFLSDASDEIINPGMPVLRKDFLFHRLQIAETAQSPASALLLIARMIPDAANLRNLREEAEKYGIESVVEIFSMHDLFLARDSGAKIIQVNSRDLSTLKVDPAACCRIINLAKPERDETWIAASGIEKTQQLREAANSGFHAALIGSHLMRGGKPGEKLRNLLGGI